MTEDTLYYQQRARAERIQADRATGEPQRLAHERLYRLYLERCGAAADREPATSL